jgi:hypothetical protein
MSLEEYKGKFVFLKDKYFEDFPDENLFRPKTHPDGKISRPFFFVFYEKSNIIWLAPVSSQIEKYRIIHNKAIDRYGRCDTIIFGKIFGEERAFLLQNMCPATEDYIDCIYSVNGEPVRLRALFEKKLVSASKRVLNLHRALVEQGRAGLIFPDVLNIEKRLFEQPSFKKKPKAQDGWLDIDPPIQCWQHEDGSYIKDDTVRIGVYLDSAKRFRTAISVSLKYVAVQKIADALYVVRLSPRFIDRVYKKTKGKIDLSENPLTIYKKTPPIL